MRPVLAPISPARTVARCAVRNIVGPVELLPHTRVYAAYTRVCRCVAFVFCITCRVVDSRHSPLYITALYSVEWTI